MEETDERRDSGKPANTGGAARTGDLRLPGAVAEIRKGIGMTQEEFAKTLSLTRRQVAEIEAGTANPTLDTLVKIGRLFGFSVGFVPKAQ